MKEKPEIGMIVALNDAGMQQVHGIRSRADFAASQRMKVIDVNRVPISDADTWSITVDGPIGKFLITNHDVDLVSKT